MYAIAINGSARPNGNTATLLRADQSGISAGENSATLERLVVDDSDQSAALSWELLALAGAMPLLALARRRGRSIWTRSEPASLRKI